MCRFLKHGNILSLLSENRIKISHLKALPSEKEGVGIFNARQHSKDLFNGDMKKSFLLKGQSTIYI